MKSAIVILLVLSFMSVTYGVSQHLKVNDLEQKNFRAMVDLEYALNR